MMIVVPHGCCPDRDRSGYLYTVSKIGLDVIIGCLVVCLISAPPLGAIAYFTCPLFNVICPQPLPSFLFIFVCFLSLHVWLSLLEPTSRSFLGLCFNPYVRYPS